MSSRPKTGGSSVLHTAESHSRRRLLSEEDCVHELVIPAKRACTVSIGSSPAVQVYGRPGICIIKRQISDGCRAGEGGIIVMPMAS